MARKHKKHGKTHRRRRHHTMGGVKGAAMNSLGLVAGAIVGNYVKSGLSGKLSVGGKDLSGVAVLAAGIFLPKFVKSPIMQSVGNGMVVSGGVSTLATFVPQIPINGIDMIGQVDTIGAYSVGAVSPVSTIGETIVNESYDEYAF